jgi:hypothetical protein
MEEFNEHYYLSYVNSLLLTGQLPHRRSMALIISKCNFIKYFILELFTEERKGRSFSYPTARLARQGPKRFAASQRHFPRSYGSYPLSYGAQFHPGIVLL